MQHSKWQWTRPPARQTDTIPWYFFISLGLFCGMIVTQVSHFSNAHHASREMQAAREDVQARTVTLAPQERIRVMLDGSNGVWTTTGSGGITAATLSYGAVAVMDPSCQVHRQQEPPPSQVRREHDGAQHVLTYNAGTETWTIPGSVNGGEERGVWQGEPRVVTHNGVVSAVVTNESIVALPESEQQALDTVKISHR